MPRFIIQPDKTSSSEYEIYDVVERRVVANGLDLQDASDGKRNREEKWEEEKKQLGH